MSNTTLSTWTATLAGLKSPSADSLKPVCILGISIGGGAEGTQNGRLEATVKALLAKQADFSKFVVVVGHTLQRWNNEARGMSPRKAYQTAIDNYEKWCGVSISVNNSSSSASAHPELTSKTAAIANNLDTVKSLIKDGVQPEILFWNDLIAKSFSGSSENVFTIQYSDQFLRQLEIIQAFSNSSFQGAVDRAIAIAAGKVNPPKEDGGNFVYKLSDVTEKIRSYIHEEMAVFKLLEKKYGSSYLVYPYTVSDVGEPLYDAFQYLFPPETAQMSFVNVKLYEHKSKTNGNGNSTHPANLLSNMSSASNNAILTGALDSTIYSGALAAFAAGIRPELVLSTLVSASAAARIRAGTNKNTPVLEGIISPAKAPANDSAQPQSDEVLNPALKPN